MRPHGVSRMTSRWSVGTQISGVRFWNLTASQPAVGGDVDQLPGDVEVTVVVDPDLADHVRRRPAPTGLSPIMTLPGGPLVAPDVTNISSICGSRGPR